MLHRIDLGRALTALGALLLLVALFLDWYDVGGTAWEVFEALDLLLAALAAGVLVAALHPDDPAPWLLRLAPLAALAVVAVQLLNAPPVVQLASDALDVDGAGDPDTGAWLALAGSALMAAGAILTLAQIRVTIDVADRGTAGAPGDDERPAAPLAEEPSGRSPQDPAEAETQVAPRSLLDDRPAADPRGPG